MKSDNMGSANCKNKSEMAHAGLTQFLDVLPCSDVFRLLLLLFIVRFGVSELLDVKCSTST